MRRVPPSPSPLPPRGEGGFRRGRGALRAPRPTLPLPWRGRCAPLSTITPSVAMGRQLLGFCKLTKRSLAAIISRFHSLPWAFYNCITQVQNGRATRVRSSNWPGIVVFVSEQKSSWLSRYGKQSLQKSYRIREARWYAQEIRRAFLFVTIYRKDAKNAKIKRRTLRSPAPSRLNPKGIV